MRGRIIPFLKSLALSGVVFIVGYALSLENRVAGTLFLAVYSTVMVVRSFRKPVPLSMLTAVLPGLMALFSFAVQASVMDYGDPELPMIGLLAGIVPGIIMGLVHRIYVENGRIWAKKSFWYLVLWGISYLMVQGAALAGIREISGGALAVSGFTSASLVMLSIFLMGKYQKNKRRLSTATMSAAGILSLFFTLAVLLTAFSPGAGHTKSHEDNVRKSADWLNRMEGNPDDEFVVDPNYYIPGDRPSRSSDTLGDTSGRSSYSRSQGGRVRQDIVDAGMAGAASQMLVAAIMAAIMSGASSAGTAAAAAAAGMAGGPLPASALMDPDTGETLPTEDGKYWVWGKWVSEDEARKWVSERNDTHARRRAEIDNRFAAERADRHAEAEARHKTRGDRYDPDTDTWYTKGHDDAVRAAAHKAARDRFNDAMLEKNRTHAADRLRRMLTDEGQDAGLVDDLIGAGKWDTVCDMFRDRVYQGIKDSVSDHAAQRRWATAAQVGQYGASVVESAAKAGVALLAVPATGGSSLAAMGAAAGATGAITGAGESAGAYFDAVDKYGPMTDKNWQKIASKTVKGSVVGFLSGAKDGAIGVYCGGPGVSKTVKVLLPAGCDAAETYLRTGDLEKAGKTGALSIIGDLGGDAVDRIGNRLARDVTGTALSMGMGGAGSYVNGGSFGEGAITGLINRTGSKMGNDVVQGLVSNKPAPGMVLSQDDDGEAGVLKAIEDMDAKQAGHLPLDKQPEVIQDLWDTRRTIVEKNPDTGEEYTMVLLDGKKAFDQLADTGSSRSAKLADPDIQQAMVDTRQKLIYDPADQATIARVLKKPEIQAKMQPGDKLVITGFSTPGTPPKVGADRDAIMCIARPDPDTGEIQMIQVDRRLWQNEAYEEFYKHTAKYANTDENGNITPESEPEFHRRKQALAHLRKRPLDDDTIARVKGQVRAKVDAQIKIENNTLKAAGMDLVDDAARQARIDALVDQRLSRLNDQFLTDDQINARAWAESRNQVFTDPYHVEASRDNSNQVFTLTRDPDGTTRPVRAQIGVETDGRVRPVRDIQGDLRTGPAILEAQQGQRRGLLDDEGYAAMWKVKSRDYADGNIPEAVAQSQKGIKQLMKLREGQRSAGVAVPPLKPHVAEAMELILRAPADATASPEKMAELDAALKSIPRSDAVDSHTQAPPAYPGGIIEAMEKLPEQNRMLGAATPDTAPGYKGLKDGPLASDAVRSAMRGTASRDNAQVLPQDDVQATQDTGPPPEPDELQERIRKLDQERAALMKQFDDKSRNT
jgi:hypothetical protein